jgi:hypothetical protein
MQRHTPRTRDIALRRLTSVNRWLVAGSAALAGVFTAVAANAFPGHTIKREASNESSRTRAHKATNGGNSPSSPSQLKSPATSPEADSGSGTESSESSPNTTPEARTTPEESTTPRAEAPPAEETKASETSPSEASRAPETQAPTETTTQPEAPVVSGGS